MSASLNNLRADFQKEYGREPRFFRVPGRVNFIGEHTDYNGGFVLPMAIEFETTVAAAPREDRKIFVRSANLDAAGEIDLNAPELKQRGSWVDFVEGVARILERQNVNLRGADLLISSDVPTGAGLSSSAALEISVGLALSEISCSTVDKVKLALFCGIFCLKSRICAMSASVTLRAAPSICRGLSGNAVAHVVTENERTLDAAEALKKNDFTEFGRLMRLSHDSLRDDYEVSCRELDLLVEIAFDCEGVLGGRMTGGGFGGSTVNLVRREAVENFTRKISDEYRRQTNIELAVYASEPVLAARRTQSRRLPEEARRDFPCSVRAAPNPAR